MSRKSSSEIEERRKEVEQLLKVNTELTDKDISIRLHCSMQTVYLDRKHLIEEGRIKSKKIIIEERRKKEEELLKSDSKLTLEYMTNILNVSIRTLYDDISYLEEQGRVENSKLTQIIKEIKEIQRNEVRKYYQQGITTGLKLIQKLDMDTNTVYEYLNELRESGELEKYDEIIKRVEELYDAGKTDEQISEMLNISIELVLKIEENLIINGRICTREEIRQIRELCIEGKSQQKISQVVFNRVASDKRTIKYINMIEQEEKYDEKIKGVEELYWRGKTDEEISQMLGISIELVLKIENNLIIQGEIATREEIRQIQELYKVGKSEKEIAQIIYNRVASDKRVAKCLRITMIIQDMENYKNTFEKRQVKIKDLNNIEKTVLETDNKYKNSIWFLKVLVTLKQFKRADTFIEKQSDNKELTEVERTKILEKKENLQIIWEKYQERVRLKNQKPTKPDGPSL